MGWLGHPELQPLGTGNPGLSLRRLLLTSEKCRVSNALAGKQSCTNDP